MGQQLVKINLRLRVDQLEKLKKRASSLGVSYNWLIRRAVEKYLTKADAGVDK